MAHTHFCRTCLAVVAVCGDACVQEEDHYCTLHHPDPAKRAPAPDLPVRMKVQIAKEGE